MKNLKREVVVEELVKNYVDMVIDNYNNNDTSYISYVFEQEGFKPFNSYTNEELKEEYSEIFGKSINIV